MLLQDFSGGLNTRVAPSLIAPNESQVFTNIDASSGSIRPLKDKTLHTADVNKYFTYYYANSEFYSKTAESSFVEYRDLLYITNLNSYPTKYGGTNEYRLGIVKPAVKPTAAYVASGTTPYGVKFGTETTGDLQVGTYNYIVVHKATTDIIKITRFSTTLDPMGAIRIYYSLTGATSVDIYREYDDTYRLVTTATTSFYYTDILFDIEANTELPTLPELPGGDYTYAYTYYNSSDGSESAPSPISDLVTGSEGKISITFSGASADLQVDKIRLYRLGGAVTQYSLLVELPNDIVDYTDITLDIDLAGNTILDTITYDPAPTGLKYLVESYAMLFGAVGDKLYYSNIALPNAWPATNFLDFEDNITGIGAIQNGLLVFTKLKTYIVTGNSPETFSKYLLDSSQGCLSHYTIQFVRGTLLWLSEDGICTSSGGLVEVLTQNKLGKITLTGIQNAQVHDGIYYLLHSTGMLVLDFRYNLMVRKVVCDANWIGAYFDKLFLQYADNLYETCSSETPLEYHYKSGVLTEGQYTNYKIFKDFYIKYNGSINLKLYIDGTKVNDVNLTGNRCYNLKAVSHANGYGLEIEIQGTGEVSEIQYTALGRQNGK